MSTVNRETITRFVRSTLGCTCPDAVFERIELAAANGGSSLRMTIGGRLLIHVERVSGSGDDLTSRLAQWLAQGASERHALGCNRFRLVLATDDPAILDPWAHAALGQLPVGDERVHVHVLSNAQVDAALDGTGWSG